MNLDVCYERDPSIIARDIAGEMILVPIRKSVGDLESIYTLNETAAFVWERFDGDHTLAEVRDAVMEEFEVELGVVKADLLELVVQLEQVGAVRRVE